MLNLVDKLILLYELLLTLAGYSFQLGQQIVLIANRLNSSTHFTPCFCSSGIIPKPANYGIL
jgi:hypothetical protein